MVYAEGELLSICVVQFEVVEGELADGDLFLKSFLSLQGKQWVPLFHHEQ